MNDEETKKAVTFALGATVVAMLCGVGSFYALDSILSPLSSSKEMFNNASSYEITSNEGFTCKQDEREATVMTIDGGGVSYTFTGAVVGDISGETRILQTGATIDGSVPQSNLEIFTKDAQTYCNEGLLPALGMG